MRAALGTAALRRAAMARQMGSRGATRAPLAALRALPDAAAQYPHGLESLTPEATMADVCARLGGVSIDAFEESRFVRPQSVHYELDGERRRWDVIDAHDSVAVVIYHTERRALLLVRQFRPALYAGLLRAAAHAAAGDGADEKSEAVAPPLAEGFTCELCAGIVDKGLTLAEIAAEEVLEETGYRVEAAALVELTAFAASVGVQGSRQTLFFVSVDEGVRESRGGGVAGDGERIELLALPLASVEAFVMDASVPKTSGAMFGLLWAKAHVLAGDDAR